MVNIIKIIQPQAKIKIAGKPLLFPFHLSDQPLKNYIGNYDQATLQYGIKQTFDTFSNLLSKKKNII